jgi:cytoskeletal protein RodZ
MREYDEDDYNIRRYVLRRVIILVAVIIAVPVMMWTITIFVRSYVERPIRQLPLTEPSLPPKPQAAQRAPAPLLTDAAKTAGDGLASLPDPNSGSLKEPLALPPGDAPPPAASPTGPAETAPNAPAVASGEAAAVTDSAQSAATAETAPSEAVTPVQRDRLTATGPATVSIAPVGPVPLPRVRPVDAPVDTPPVPSLFAPAPWGYPALQNAH